MKLSLIGLVAILANTSAFVPTMHGMTTSPARTAVDTARHMSDTWYEEDTCVTLVPKFKIKEGMREPYVALLPKFVELVKANEPDTCVHYGFVSGMK